VKVETQVAVEVRLQFLSVSALYCMYIVINFQLSPPYPPTPKGKRRQYPLGGVMGEPWNCLEVWGREFVLVLKGIEPN
jgi:hypothetical protein